jgi:uncharacterized protein (DUF1330 family)
MKAYCIFDVREVIDPEGLERYTRGVLETVQAHGGRYLSVGGKCQVVEGDWSPGFLVLIEFPGIEQARAWYDSPQYAGLRQLRLESSRGDAVIVEPEAGALREQLVGEA